MTLAGTGSGSERWFTETFHKNSRELGDSSSGKARRQWPRLMATVRAACPSRSRTRAASRNSQSISPSTMPRARPIPRAASRGRGRRCTISRRHQAARDPGADRGRRRGRPLHRAEPVPEVGDPASGLIVFPKTGHVVNLEEPDLFNQVVGDFLPASTPAAGHRAIRARCPTNGAAALEPNGGQTYLRRDAKCGSRRC